MSAFPAAMFTASKRGRAWAPLLGLVVLLLGAAAPACKLNQQGVPPELDRISFPASALVDPDGKWLYVANSNSDLRFNSGTLVAVDLDATVRDRFGDPQAGWKVCAGADRVRVDTDPDPCCWDYLDHNILNCDDRLYIPPDSTIELGSFSAGMEFQTFDEPACPPGTSPPAPPDQAANRHACSASCTVDDTGSLGRLFIGVRGNSTVSYVDTSRVADPATGAARPRFKCPADSSYDHACTITQTMPEGTAAMPASPPPGDVTTPIQVPDEPYALALDETQDLLYVGNLRGDTAHPQTGGISLFDVSRGVTGDALPTFIGPSSSFFNPDANGNFGITSLTKHNHQVYASSRYGTNVVNVVPSFSSGAGLTGTPYDCHLDAKMLSLSGGSDVFTTPFVGAEIRGIQFLSEETQPMNNRAFVLQRTPPALVGFDISTTAQSFGNFPSDILETCAGPTFLQAYDAGEGTRLYVTCFDAGQIYIFDPTVPRLIAVLNAGRGPAGLTFPDQPRGDHALAYVVGFSANDISVVDLTPRSTTQYHVVQRIGFPTLVPR
jgi:hypothetical protein